MPTPHDPKNAKNRRSHEDLLAEFDVTDEVVDQVLGAPSVSGVPGDPTGGETPARSATPSAPPVPSTPARSDSLVVKLARELGMDDDEIDSYSPENLERTVDLLRRAENRRVSATHASLDNRQPTTPSASGAVDAPRPESHVPPAGASPSREFDLGVPQADLDNFDPEYVALLKKVMGTFQAKVDALAEQLGAVRQWATSRQQAEEFDRFDNAFKKAHAALPAMFSQASRHDLDGNSDEMARRRAVVVEMQRQAAVAQAAGRKASFDGLFAAALKSLYGVSAPDATPSPGGAPPTAPGVETPRAGRPQKYPGGPFLSDREIEELNARKADWAEGGLERPTARDNRPEPRGEDRAKRTLSRLLNGAPVNAAPGGEEDTLPD